MSSESTGSKNYTGLKTRVLSGLILGPLILGVILYGSWPFLLLMALASYLAFYEFIGLVKDQSYQHINILLGFFYLAACFGAFIFLRFGFDAGAWLTLAVILCVWASDIGAYFTGKTIGGPKMSPKLSPNKTWAGLGGAMFFCALGLTAALYAGANFDRSALAIDITHMPYIFIGGLLLGIIGQGGDLFISYYKRRSGAKDTGHLIPGHGGLLDRIDSLLLVSPAFLVMLLLCL